MATLEDAVAHRAGWTFDAGVATYTGSRDGENGWIARVRQFREPRRGAIRWHAAAIDPRTGAAGTALTAYTPEEAIRWSESIIAKE